MLKSRHENFATLNEHSISDPNASILRFSHELLRYTGSKLNYFFLFVLRNYLTARISKIRVFHLKDKVALLYVVDRILMSSVCVLWRQRGIFDKQEPPKITQPTAGMTRRCGAGPFLTGSGSRAYI